MNPFNNPLQKWTPFHTIGVHFKHPKLKPKFKIGLN